MISPLVGVSKLPGTRLANSTTLCTVGVMCAASCCHNHIFCCSSPSAVEDATSGLVHPCAGFASGNRTKRTISAKRVRYLDDGREGRVTRDRPGRTVDGPFRAYGAGVHGFEHLGTDGVTGNRCVRPGFVRHRSTAASRPLKTRAIPSPGPGQIFDLGALVYYD